VTFSLVARDPATGSFGLVLSSSSPAVGSRCVYLRAGAGAVASQNVTSPALGQAVLDALAAGADAAAALRAGLAGEPHPGYRQVTVVDAAGRVAVHGGARALGVHAHVTGDGAAAAGNLLASERVPERMLAAYRASAATAFEERLLDGLRGALAAGGEAGQVRSAALAVVDAVAWRTTDLRVDDHDDPAGELARLLALWLPQKADYLARALDPAAAPSYGVPGDPVVPRETVERAGDTT
jgi:uncharacterized Ntn-hydrolase superfamily protein